MVARDKWRWSGHIKALILTALLLPPIRALAASQEDDYVATRDRYMAELKRLEAPEDAGAHKALQEKDTKDLEQRLKTLIGPFAATGFPSEGELNADLYAGDPSFGEIDGLVYGDKDNEDGVIVTTDGLLDKWLLSHPRRWSKSAVPHSAAAAVATEAFYTQGLNRQGDVALYAFVPVVAPPGAKFAKAMLATSDIGPEISETPDRLFIALEKGGRVFIASVRPAPPLEGIAACNAVLAGYDRKVDAAEKAQTKRRASPEKLHEQGQAAFLTCFKDRIKTAPELAALTKQATAIVEVLAKN